MKKIKSLFKRNYEGNRLVYNEVVEGCEWVIEGEGTPTRKIDGTCCMIKNRILYKRYDVKKGRKEPEGFIPAQDKDETTGHWPGWIIVDATNPSNKWHVKAFVKIDSTPVDGVYELIGPKINKNPEGAGEHKLISIKSQELILPNTTPREFELIKLWFVGKDIEGIVWHHPDGRMCKIKKKDFGLNRKDN